MRSTSPGSLRNHVQMEPGQRVYGDILEKAGQKVHRTGQNKWECLFSFEESKGDQNMV